MGNLTANMLRGSLKPGRHHDGDGLFLNVTPTGARSWICRVQKSGRRRDIGLGSAKKVSLAQARQRAAEVRSQVEAGIDPVLQRKKAEGIPTFREAAAAVYAENKKTWKNKKHRGQWLTSLQTYAFPKIGDVAVSDIESSHVRDVLIAIWLEKNETARRVRQRIGMVIDWAIAKNYRAHPLPMNAINKSLPKVRNRQNHLAALHYSKVAAFVGKLRERESIGRLAFEFLILTAARSGEVRGALWSEIDLTERTWTIPAERMKADVEHVVPLSDAALGVLRRARVHKEDDNDLVFPGTRHGKPMSDMTLTKICRDAEIDAVPHGFRSSFRDWVSEETDFDRDVAEMALAHTIANPVEAAYRRGKLLQKRRKLMDLWAEYCAVTRT
ncbi:integrase [Erythromicrobium ramosum]|uniref:Integrase n=1 Tax=Erythrobacter ramosus TaxID=35811 RepID=A0A6I4UDY2_9SPHN|nr:site-specific integrase [Erythrobacter ramosus]MBB3775267.1 integrase [Erythrobacter ramosus]MXP37112.1 integrase arm-type DNA-binding domain-containing protein [Erythrobacter ramosus]